MTALPLSLVLAIAAPAQAADFTIRLFSEITFQGLSELTSTSTDASSSERHAEQPPPRVRKQGPDGSACRQHDDCRGWCQSGVCMQPQAARCTSNEQCSQGFMCWSGQCVQAQQQPMCTSNAQCAQGFMCWSGQCVQAQQQQGCASNAQCAPGFVCWNSQCVQGAESPPPMPAAACTVNEQCGPGLVCLNGACVTPPTLRRGTELFLRQRVVQLRQELTFGEGPVITALASFHHVSPVELGRTLRSHRAELETLMGDGSDDAWAGRFLRRVEELELTCRG